MSSRVSPSPPEQLRRWGDVVVMQEITQSNRASFTWEVVVNGGRAVAKLTCDAPPKVEPGLRIARLVQQDTGVLTGVPIATRDGSLTVAVRQSDGRVWTLAVLAYVEGHAIRTLSEDTAAEAGALLARVHQCTRLIERSAVPAQLLDWFREVGDARAGTIVDELEARPLTHGVVYGDPSPELIRTPSGDLALIDWGTPSHGPLAHDIVMWERRVRRCAEGGSASVSAAFVDAYRRWGPCRGPDFEALPLCSALWPQ